MKLFFTIMLKLFLTEYGLNIALNFFCLITIRIRLSLIVLIIGVILKIRIILLLILIIIIIIIITSIVRIIIIQE